MIDSLRLRVLTEDQVSTIYDKCLEFLSTKGVKVTHPEGLKIFDKAGAQVDYNNHQVRFPKDIIETALRSAPHGFTLASSNARNDAILPHPEGFFYRLGNTGEPEYLEPESNTVRPLTRTDVVEWAQLLEALDNIPLAATPFVTDVPKEIADICGIKTLFENTSKHIMIHPYSFDSLEYLIELGKVVAGDTEALKERPIVSMIICALSPFSFKDMDIEAIILSARSGVPMHIFALPLAGATSPVTIAGTVLQMGIEILAQLVMSQLIVPGAKVIAAPFAFTLDMVTGRNLQQSVEATIIATASVQFFKEVFHIPTHYEPGADSHIPDGHAQIEKSLSGLMVARAGCDILAGAGQLDVIRVSSPLQLIIDNDLVSVFKRLCSPVKGDNDYLAWQDILDIAPGGTYLERRHTLQHCREALRPQFLATLSRDTWISEGSKDLYTRTLDKYRELKKKLKPLELPEDVQKELNRVEKQAREHLVK
jgi:trimethylamine--corrinoid protein Co-methyltransferase